MIDQRGTEGWRTVRLSRRHLIRLSGMLGAGLAVACSRIPAAGPGAGQPTDVESPIANETPAGTPIALPRRSPPADVDAYLRIGPEGNVTLFTGKVEFGQGVQTGFAQLAAEELDVPLEHMNVVMGVTNQAPFDTGTFGSQSTRGTGPVIRQAAAEMHQWLLELGSARLGLPVDQVQSKAGAVVATSDPGRSVSYADLAAGKELEPIHQGACAEEGSRPIHSRRPVGRKTGYP